MPCAALTHCLSPQDCLISGVPSSSAVPLCSSISFSFPFSFPLLNSNYRTEANQKCSWCWNMLPWWTDTWAVSVWWPETFLEEDSQISGISCPTQTCRHWALAVLESRVQDRIDPGFGLLLLKSHCFPETHPAQIVLPSSNLWNGTCILAPSQGWQSIHIWCKWQCLHS